MTIFLKVLGFLILAGKITMKVINIHRVNGRNNSRYSEDLEPVKVFGVKYIIPLVCAALAVFLIGCSIIIIPTGYTGVDNMCCIFFKMMLE